jgi:hypothetical protein
MRSYNSGLINNNTDCNYYTSKNMSNSENASCCRMECVTYEHLFLNQNKHEDAQIMQ